MGPSATEGDAECTEAIAQILPWILPPDETKKIFEDGHGTTPYLNYARRMPATPDPDLNNVNKIKFILILVEVRFCGDLGCDITLTGKTEKYSPSSWPSRNTGEELSSSPSTSDTQVVPRY
jgi:hypothetical protein